MSKESLCIGDVILGYGINVGKRLHQRIFLILVIEMFV